MVVKGKVVGFQVFQSGAAQIFVACEPNSNEKIKEAGAIVRAFWKAKGSYSFDNPPDLVGAYVVGFVGREQSGILEMTGKGGENL